MSPFLYRMYEYFNNYVIAKCLLSCVVLLMLIGSRQYTYVLFPLKHLIEFNSIDICSFIPVIGCIGMDPSALICPGAYNAVKMALI